MKVAEYRDLIDAVSQWRTSLLSAVTSHEQRCEANRLRTAVDILEATSCPRASLKDRERAARIIGICRELLAEKQKQFNAADMSLCNMAFAGDWR